MAPAEPDDNSITVGVRATDGLFGQPKTKTTKMKENCFHFWHECTLGPVYTEIEYLKGDGCQSTLNGG